MLATIERKSIEAEISDCCLAIYWTTDPQVAMSNWDRLRELKRQRTRAQDNLFNQEARLGTLERSGVIGPAVPCL